jgi:carboxyl-terminal processing protease
MTRFFASLRPALRHLTLSGAALLLATSLSFGASDHKFESTPTLRTEARQVVNLLEQVHYNRDAVHPADYTQVIGDFMGELDGQRLFFLGSDKTDFTNRYSKNLYWNIKNLGNIDAAYEIFDVYQTRATSRIGWIFEELKKEADLTANDYYSIDRSKSNWPENAAASDELWQKRLKFEVLAEILNKKTPEEARQAVHKRYERLLKNIGEFEGLDLAEIFLSTVTHLYDPHSTYFSADTYEDFSIQMKLQLVGIGALLGIEEDYCVVKEIIPGGPADLNKQLKPNDKIISVAQTGGEPVEIIGMKLRKIVDMIRGAKDSKVHLVVQPADATDPATRKDIFITRDLVKLSDRRAHAAIFQLPDAEGKTTPIGVITLPAFYGANDSEDGDTEKTSASKDVSDLITQLKQAGIKGMVLDLRHNGGGLLSEAIELTGLFVGKGPVVQVKDYNSSINVDSDENPNIAYSGPLAVLVDRFSASASEIVAGALQNYGRGIVIGDSSTHGKGSVQTVVEMRNVIPTLARTPIKTGATKLTIQKFYLPNGSSTQLKGVVPDIVLPSIDDYLPIGESDLPHALVWDEIPTSFFEGKPLDAQVLSPLRDASAKRQNTLEEFAYLKKNVTWFKSRQEQKLVSLNADLRRKQKVDDDAFRKEMKAEYARLSKNEFSYKEFRLGPPQPPKIKAPKKADDKSDDDDDEDELSTDDDTYSKVDIHLRESLRVVGDALQLSKTPQALASDHAPLTALGSKG